MAKLANYLYVEKVGNQYIYRMTPELQDDVGTVGYVCLLYTSPSPRD